MKKDSVEILEGIDNSNLQNDGHTLLTSMEMKALREAIDLMKAVKVVDGILPKEQFDIGLQNDGSSKLIATKWQSGYNQAIKDCKTAMVGKLVAMQEDMPAEYSKLVNKHFWELI